jgi:ABC-2 type transport system ATP-binding protein
VTSIAVSGVTKHYRDVAAVSDLTFEVAAGDFFGLLGPNGAGKTTTIRMILGLIVPTSGDIRVLGQPMSQAVRRRIGYLPEERGLYRDVGVVDGLVYLATLKGVARSEARRRAREGLDRLGLGHVGNKPLKALSRGMQQKVQFLATVLHQPELLIIDEPFSGLDPVNTLVLRDMLLELHGRGCTIVMSAHEMHRVEELCERVLLLQGGRAVLYGSLDEIRHLFAGGTLIVEAEGDLASVRGVEEVREARGGRELILERGASPDAVFHALAERDDIKVTRFEVHLPTLEEIFIAVAGKGPAAAPSGRAGATSGNGVGSGHGGPAVDGK